MRATVRWPEIARNSGRSERDRVIARGSEKDRVIARESERGRGWREIARESEDMREGPSDSASE